MEDILVVDSATRLGPEAAGRIVVCGSHGGVYAAWLCAKAKVRGVILHDAGIGRHSAGISGVIWLANVGIPACAVDHRSARIGDGEDMLANGTVGTANEAAAVFGCLPGHTALQSARCMLENAPAQELDVPEEFGETRKRVPNTGHRAVWAIDSVALTREEDRRAVIVTGSHGGLLGGRDDGMPAEDVFAAFFNDAGGGKDDAGFARLPALDPRGIAAATVSCQTARIGDGRSTYDTGVLSRVNEVAARLELKPGMTAREAVARLVGLG
jgi:hypothetical protein